MALEGTLSDFSLADIFQLIGIQHKTGVLTLRDADITVRVHFRDGKVINADSVRQDEEDRLGHVLVKTGRISDPQLQEALRIQKETLQQLGHILVSRGYMTELALGDSLRMQVTQMVYRLFRWKEGEYHFDQDAEVVLLHESFEPMASEAILMEGVRMLDEWPLIESRISSPTMVFRRAHPGAVVEEVAEIDEADTDDDSHLRALIGGERAEQRLKVTSQEAVVYARVDGRRTVRDIVESVPLYEFDACRCLYEMAERNVIVEATPRTVAKQQAAAPAAPRESSGGLVRALYVLLSVWLCVAFATKQNNPLDYWAWPPTGNMKADAFDAASLKLVLEKVSLALEAFHADRGSYPERLDQLVGAGLMRAGEVGGDSVTPIEYKIVGDGFTLSYARGLGAKP